MKRVRTERYSVNNDMAMSYVAVGLFVRGDVCTSCFSHNTLSSNGLVRSAFKRSMLVKTLHQIQMLAISFENYKAYKFFDALRYISDTRDTIQVSLLLSRDPR
jgi:hypothetical protein